ncbi:unnamed protein product, partial [Brenthis ino]
MAFATRLFVGNLPDNLDENALREAFSSYGNITNFDLKSKPGIENDKKKFAFITISASNFNIESCIKYFSNEDFQGNKLYVTRARESFLERLQREREQSQKNVPQKIDHMEVESERYNTNGNNNFHKREFDQDSLDNNYRKKKPKVSEEPKHVSDIHFSKKINCEGKDKIESVIPVDEKKQNSDKKRMESMKKKRQEFNQKKNIIKSGFISIDKKPNKKVIFSDTEDNITENNVIFNGTNKKDINSKTSLFDDEASDDEINFEIKEQYEGKKGQKVLDLQSMYKADKRFVLDERFVEDEENTDEQEKVELEQADEKSKQLNILQDVLGIPIRMKPAESTVKAKAKFGMLRFDPMQPEHAKYLAPVEMKPESTKKSKKKKDKEPIVEEQVAVPEPVVEKVEVSKEQFYKISDSLKEAITQPNEFSLRSLFRKDDVQEEDTQPAQDKDFISITAKKDPKVKNPLDPGERNPFVYDSSESENEDDNVQETVQEKAETKTVWREKLFFSTGDVRLKDGLLFFAKKNENEGPKERRELKSLMKKRIYNKERKNTMFQKKIGGRKKMMKRKLKKN